MGIRAQLLKTAFLISYLILVVTFPSSRGERLQKYHFFQLIEKYQAVPLHDFPVVGNMSLHNHRHFPLFFYPAKRILIPGNSFPAAISPVAPITGLSVMIADRLTASSGPSPPIFYSKTVSGLSPPRYSEV